MSRRRWEAVLAVLLSAVGFASAAFGLARHRAFWSPDSGLRYVQVEALIRQGYRRVSIPYPGARFDPEGEHLPFSNWFMVQRGGEVYIVYPPYFPALASLPYRVLGFLGLFVLPVAGVVAILWATAQFAHRLPPPWPVLSVVAVLGTPLAAYGVLFWDHAPMAALTTGAAAFALSAGIRRLLWPAFLSGLLAGLGVWLRTEAYLFATTLFFATWILFGRRTAAWIAAGSLVPAVAVWVLNGFLFGHPLGLKGEAALGGRVAEVALAHQEVWAWLRRRLLVAYDLLASTERGETSESLQRIIPSLTVTGAVLGGGVLLWWGGRKRDPTRVVAGAVLAVSAPVWLAARQEHMIGLLPTMPFVAAVSLSLPCPAPEARFPLFLALLYTATVMATASTGGLQWGPRYLLPAIPLFVWAAFVALARFADHWPDGGRALRFAAGLLVAGGIAIQVVGVSTMHSSVATLAALSEEVERRSAPVLVSGAEPLLRAVAPLYFRKVLLRVQGPEALRSLVRKLAQARVREWTYIPFTGPRFDRTQIERWSEEGDWRFRVVRDETLPMAFIAEAREYRAVTPVRLITYRRSNL